MKRWNISLQSGGLEQMALTLYVFDGIRGMLSLVDRFRGSTHIKPLH